MIHRRFALTEVCTKGQIVLFSSVRSGGERKEGIAVVDANGELYVFPALKDPVRDSRGMLGNMADLMIRGLIDEHAREVAREEHQIRP